MAKHKRLSPVILTAGHAGRRLARRLFARHGLTSHLFTPRPSLSARMCPWQFVHRLPSPLCPDMVSLPLFDLADEIEEQGRVPLLYLCNDLPPLDGALVALLETRYILCRGNGNEPLPALFSEGEPL